MYNFNIHVHFRLLVVVRDPVTRAISDYTQATSKKADMKKFEELAFINGSYEVVDTSWGPVKIGVYARHLERWLQYFPLSQLLFISGERLIVDPAFEIGRVQVSKDDSCSNMRNFLITMCFPGFSWPETSRD